MAKERRIVLRLLGSTAFVAHCKQFSHLFGKLKRELTDIDFAGYSNQYKEIKAFLGSIGYRDNPTVTMLFSDRIKFTDNQNRVVDIFLDKLSMCHTIDFKNRLELDYPTIPLADLLLEKMQIVQLTEKDAKDVLVLIREHEIGRGDNETINSEYISDLLSKDWGFYHTVTTNLKKVRDEFTPKYEFLGENDRSFIITRINALISAIDAKPKSMKWKLRARTGTSQRWYQEIESK